MQIHRVEDQCSGKKVSFACGQAMWAGPKSSTQNASCTMPCTFAWSSPAAWCQSHHYLSCFGYKASLPLPFVSPDPEQTDNDQVSQTSNFRLPLCDPPPSTSAKKAEAQGELQSF